MKENEREKFAKTDRFCKRTDCMRGYNPVPQFLKAEAAFLDRQRELQDLHHQLQSVLDGMGKIEPTIRGGFQVTNPVDDDSFDELQLLYKTEMSSDQQTRLLIREIQQIQVDVEDVRASLMERCGASKKTQVALIIQQLTELDQVLDKQLARAERLIQ